MENKFILKYINFARSIDTANKIIAVITNDYNLKMIEDYIEKQDDYKKSVDNMVNYLNDMSGISPDQKKKVKALIRDIKKTENKLDRSSEAPYNMLRHYAADIDKRKIGFIIVFKNGDVWNVNFTASLRADRSDTHLYRFSNSIATKNYLIVCSYPYQDEQSKNCINDIKMNNNFCNVKLNVVCLEEFMDEILFNIYRYKVDKNDRERISLAQPKELLSIVNGQRGPKIEDMYAEVIDNAENFKLYSDKINSVEREKKDGAFLPNHYEIIIERLLSDLGVTVSQISGINAVPIGYLGEKADVYVSIELKDGTVYKKGISIKSSSIDEVSVHEKHASDFIKVLNITDDDVAQGLNDYEELGAFGKLETKYYNALKKYFEDKDHVYGLVKWAIIGAETDEYKADYVILHSYVYNEHEARGHGIKIFSCQEYIDKLMQSEKEGSLGTHLQWTYKGNLQLKTPFFFEESE